MDTEYRPPRVFISYAYDSDEHRRQVHQLAQFLRREGGIDVRFDEWATHQRRDWAVWMIDQLHNADFVLVVASPAYKRRAEGQAAASDGRGVQFEAALLRDLLTKDRPTWIPKVLPVMLPGRSIDEIPAFLQPYSASRYQVRSFTIDGIDELYRVLTGQPRHPSPELGPLLVRPPATIPTGDTTPTWLAGQEIQVNATDYLMEMVDDEEFEADRSWVRRAAVARTATPPARLVEIRQISIRRHDESARRRHRALLAAGTLLVDTANVPGIPRLLDQMSDHTNVTLVLERPEGPNLLDLYGSSNPSEPLAPARTAGFLRIVRQLCRSLQSWHQRGFSHRALTPNSIVLMNNGRTPTLRDIGLADVDPTPGEGIAPYQAPEQLHSAPGPGPRTDVFQLATIVHDILTGERNPRLSPRLTQLLANAQSPTPDHRPRDAASFGTRLSQIIDDRSAL